MFPQDPQLFGSLLKSVSHPFAPIPSQFPKFGLQEKLQAPPPQFPLVAFGAEAGQTIPQPPQFELLLESGVSQPVEDLKSQSPNPVLH